MHGLHGFINLVNPDLVLLSEPMIFASDLDYCMSIFKGEYSFHLNSEDRLDPEIALSKTKALGGTLVMWRKSLDKFVTIHPSPSTSFLPLVLSPPGCPVSIHIAIYLPTSGKETQFLEEILLLENTLDELRDLYQDCLIYIKGDGNVNPNNKDRSEIFQNFLSNNHLKLVNITHKTYHHFLGGGAFDSNIDIIAQTSETVCSEAVTRIFCRNEYPEIDSHHDLLVSKVSFPKSEKLSTMCNDLLTAPKVPNTRRKIIWSDEGIECYRDEVMHKLSEIRQRWLDPLSPTSLAILLHNTNDILNRAAIITNKSIDLTNKKVVKSEKKQRSIIKSEKGLKDLSRLPGENFRENEAFKKAQSQHRALIRKSKVAHNAGHDKQFFSILSSSPSKAFNAIRSARTSTVPQVPYVVVGGKKYDGDRVIDGLFESILKLKTLDKIKLASSPYHSDLMADYENIKYICTDKIDIPQLSLQKSTSILNSLKPSVMDLQSITASHYMNAGIAGYIHFNCILNAFISNINNTSIEELNSVYALFLHKGHNKDRTQDSSYRTISTCPLVAKGLDLYVRELSLAKWNSVQAPTQYQGEGSNHELASLAVTEAIQSSHFSLSKPIFLLFLDAKSAFDSVVIPYLIRSMYLSGTQGSSLLYLDKRLSNRITYCEFDKTLAGPIHDELGLEQGGVSSSDGYKLYSNELLVTAQESELGVDMGGNLVLSAVGQADDTVLMSNDIIKLNLLLHLAKNYCDKFNVQLSQSKTKLLMIPPPRIQTCVTFNPIKINEKEVQFVDQAEHVGIVRANEGNMPNIFKRISSFKKSLGNLVSCGLARGHRSNPAASLRIMSIYCTPVLMSGLGSLLLSDKEIALIDQQFKRTLQKLLKLPVNTPSCMVYFTSGNLPATALIHLKYFSLFGMICRLVHDPLHAHALQVLHTTQLTPNSWFVRLRNLLIQYDLPHPLTLLRSPPSKAHFKKQVKLKVLDYWNEQLRGEASFLSAPFFHPCH